jgi:hypothetical protein
VFLSRRIMCEFPRRIGLMGAKNGQAANLLQPPRAGFAGWWKEACSVPAGGTLAGGTSKRGTLAGGTSKRGRTAHQDIPLAPRLVEETRRAHALPSREPPAGQHLLSPGHCPCSSCSKQALPTGLTASRTRGRFRGLVLLVRGQGRNSHQAVPNALFAYGLGPSGSLV